MKTKDFSSEIWYNKKVSIKNYFKEKKNSKFLIIGLAGVIFSLLGYFINTKILIKYFSFTSFQDLSYTYINFPNLLKVFSDFLVSLGYVEGNIFSAATIQNLTAITIAIAGILAIINAIRNPKVSKENRFLVLFFISAIVIYLGLYSCTNLIYNPRYNLPIIIFIFPIIMINLKELEVSKKTKKIISFGLLSLCALSSFFVYKSQYQSDRTYEFRQIINNILPQDYLNGYATFWNANVITELSNGKIEIYTWQDSCDDGSCFSNVKNVNQLFEWLQNKKHLTEKPKGKVFTLYRRNELEHCQWKNNLKDQDIIYQTENYVVYGYDNYEDMLKSSGGNNEK